MKIVGARSIRAVPSGICTWLTSVGMLTVLTGPVIIHAICEHEPRFTEIVTLLEKRGPFLVQLGMDGSTTTISAAHVTHDGDRLAWIMRICSAAEAVLDVETELTAVSAHAYTVSWSQQSVGYRSGECRNVAVRANVPADAPAGHYEVRPALRIVLKSGRILVGKLTSLPLTVASGPPD